MFSVFIFFFQMGFNIIVFSFDCRYVVLCYEVAREGEIFSVLLPEEVWATTGCNAVN